MNTLDSADLKRRPIDLLFGDMGDSSHEHTLLFTEQAVMAVQPEGMDNEAQIMTVSVPEAQACAVSGQGLSAGPVDACLPHAQATLPSETDISAMVSPAKANPPLSDEYRNLASTIDALYRQISEEGSDSPRLRKHCLTLLAESGSALESEEYAQAGYSIQQVEARLLRARLSEKLARSSLLKLVWAWEIAVALGAVTAILLPFYVVLVPSLVPFLRAIAFGTLGGLFVPFRSLISRFRRAAYAPSYDAEYWMSPLRGALIGGVVFLFSELGVIAAAGALGSSRFFGASSGAHYLMYSFAVLAGMGSDAILVIIRNVLRLVQHLSAPAHFSSEKAGQSTSQFVQT